MPFYSLLFCLLSSLSFVFTHRIQSRSCPLLADGSSLQFAETPRIILNEDSNPFSCRRALECDTLASPPEAAVYWYRDGKLIHATVHRDATLSGPFVEQSVVLGMGQLRHRLCIDHHLGQAKKTEFKCRIQSPCDMTQVLESPALVVESNGKPSPSSNQIRKAPLITLISSSRVEFSGKFVQLYCNAAGVPKPEVEWKVVDSQDESIVYPIEDFPFIWTINNSDILIDTAKTDAASVTLKCVAANRFGSDSAISTLVLITNE